ncbi:hypothetical protein BJ742DRAFT_221035 [Cladochytrium replicatum]|nr:hypothetical protein BJ742DRAFT_221035 [Cladochytrium replicatum]
MEQLLETPPCSERGDVGRGGSGAAFNVRLGGGGGGGGGGGAPEGGGGEEEENGGGGGPAMFEQEHFDPILSRRPLFLSAPLSGSDTFDMGSSSDSGDCLSLVSEPSLVVDSTKAIALKWEEDETEGTRVLYPSTVFTAAFIGASGICGAANEPNDDIDETDPRPLREPCLGRDMDIPESSKDSLRSPSLRSGTPTPSYFALVCHFA